MPEIPLKDTVPLSEEAFKIGIILLRMTANGENSALIDQLYAECAGLSNTMLIIERRVEVFKLPVTKSGIIALCLLGDFNPGRTILALIESLADRDERKSESKINVEYIFKYVYPNGFYRREIAHKLFDKYRNDKQHKYGYICM